MSREHEYLSKRLQPVMDLLYQRGRMTATELEEQLPGQPANSTVRSHLRVLEAKGLVGHVEENGKYIFFPTQDRPSAAKSFMQRALRTFFGGSVDRAFASLLDARDQDLSMEELDRLSKMIEAAKHRQSGEDR